MIKRKQTLIFNLYYHKNTDKFMNSYLKFIQIKSFSLITLCKILDMIIFDKFFRCSVNLRNSYGSTVTQKIQTWTWAKSQPAEDREYVASAYFLA